jgi:hypothetical protein
MAIGQFNHDQPLGMFVTSQKIIALVIFDCFLDGQAESMRRECGLWLQECGN